MVSSESSERWLFLQAQLTQFASFATPEDGSILGGGMPGMDIDGCASRAVMGYDWLGFTRLNGQSQCE